MLPSVEPPRILLVDDEPAIRDAVGEALRERGLWVRTAEDGGDPDGLLREARPDLAILDVMLPGANGFRVARRLREHGDIPVIFLTARDDLGSRLRGFDAGADDYVVKPFLLEELVARVIALLRRSGRMAGAAVQVGDLVVDEAGGVALRHGEALDLTATEFRLLVQLARTRGRVISKTQLLTQVWGYDLYDPNVVEVHVSALRRKTEADGAPRLIHTVRGLGYALRPPAS